MQSEEEAILTTKLSKKEKTSKKKSQHVPKTAPYIDLFLCLHFHLTLKAATGTLRLPSTSTGEKSMKTVDIALLSAA